MRELAPAKVNVCLYLGPARPDGYHELLSVMQSITLADTLELRDNDGDADEVRCRAVAGPNLAAAAIAAFRESTGWDGPPQLLEIAKQIPVAAGLGGGSADAAATLRLLGAAVGQRDAGPAARDRDDARRRRPQPAPTRPLARAGDRRAVDKAAGPRRLWRCAPPVRGEAPDEGGL